MSVLDEQQRGWRGAILDEGYNQMRRGLATGAMGKGHSHAVNESRGEVSRVLASGDEARVRYSGD